MLKHKSVVVLALVVIASMVLAACQPQTIIQTVEVTKEVMVVETQIVEVVETQIVEVEQAAADAFTTPHPILSDLRVRQAMAYCTNKVDVAKAGYPLLSDEQAQGLVLNTFIRQGHWAYAGDENITIYEFSPEKGGALLDEAGWTLGEDAAYRTNADGETLLLKFATTNAAFRQAWAAVWESQMADCGIMIQRSHVPASWWFGDTTGLARRDFELGAYAWVGQADPGGQTLWACDQIPLPENNWEGQNYMGWCNEEASVAIKKANNTLVQQERVDNYTIVQAAYTADVPAIPLFNRTETFAAVSGISGFAPIPGEEYYTYNVQDWALEGSDTIVLGFTQEPATLYTVVESAMVTNLAYSLMGFVRSYTTLDYNFEPLLLTEFPTLENGKATNDTVEVKEGDMVSDANGEVVELAAGVQIIDAEGNTVDYTGGTVQMKQLTETFQWLDTIKWQDGSALSQADFELGYKIICDRESGATTFITCDKTASMEFAGLGYTHKYIPGVQDPFYYLPPFGFVPANQPIESEGPYKGMTLKDVPAKDWATLPEVAEMPWSFGPYKIVEWVKGEKMVFAANEFFYGGAPKTPNFVISFITPENAEAQLLGGQVDILDSTTLAGLTETLVTAEADGKIVTFVNPGATWEHIDFNLFLK